VKSKKDGTMGAAKMAYTTLMERKVNLKLEKIVKNLRNRVVVSEENKEKVKKEKKYKFGNSFKKCNA
jgi:hypothetical protein